MNNSDESEIKAIIHEIAHHDDQIAFRQFFNIYYHRLLNFAYYFLESSVAAEEVVSSVFISLWEKRKELTKIDRVEAYIFSSTKNKSFNYLRDNKRSIQLKDIDSEDDFLVPIFENPESKLLNEELKEKIIEIIEELPPKCKMIFTLIREDGMKYKEVAKLLDISIKTVEVQMGRALAKLKSSIKPYLHELDLTDSADREDIKKEGAK